jgi:glycosyltransferase involved in cell wall biosynthesis
MKVAVVNNQNPFVRGGAELLAEGLRDKLVEFGHDAELIRIPFRWSPPQRIVEHMLASRLIHLGNADRVIALKFPAYYIQHDEKVLWLVHQFRQVYDLYGTEYQDLPVCGETEGIRAMVRRWDADHLSAAQARFAISEITAERLKRFNGLDSEVLLPPLKSTDGFRCESYRDYIFAGGRISGGKRHRLLVEAMRHVSSDVKLVIAGPPESPQIADDLHRLIRDHSLADRVTLDARWLGDDEKQALLANALACACVPYDEEYGYVALEAFHSRKAVVTCTDSGGTLSLVVDGASGIVAEPRADAIAAAFDRLREDVHFAGRLGEGAEARIAELDIHWDAAIARLTA